VVQKILKNSLAAFAFQFLNRGLGFGCFILIARLLGIEKIGHFTYILSLCALLTLFVEFGTNQFLVKEVASNGGKVDATALISILFLKLIQYLIGLIVLFSIEFKTLITDFTIINCLFLYVLFDSIAQTGISILNGRKEFIKANKYSFFYESGRSLFLLLLILLTGSEIVIPFVYIFSAFLFSILISRKVFTINLSVGLFYPDRIFKSIKKSYRSTYLFFLAAIAFQLYFRIDIILLRRLSSEFELGVYGTAYKFFEVFLFVPAIVSGIVYPHVVEMFKSDKWKVSKYLSEIQLKSTCLLAIPVVVLILLSDFIINLFFDASFSGAGSIMQILFLTSFLFCFNFVYPVLMNAGGWERNSIYTYLIGMVLNVILNFMLIPRYGAAGAAYATLIAELFVTTIFILFSYKEKVGFINSTALITLAVCLILVLFKVAFLALPLLLLIILFVFRTELNWKQKLHARG